MSNKCCSGGRKDKGGGGGSRSKKVVCEELCVTKYVKDVLLHRKMVRVTVVWKRGCDKVVCERCAKKTQCTVLRPTKLNVLSWDQQDPAPPFCTKQMKDITVRCNRLSCSLHTHVSIAVTKLRKQFFTGRVKPFLRQWHMNDSFANYQIIHEAILRSTRECTSIVTKILNMTIEMKLRTLHQPML